MGSGSFLIPQVVNIQHAFLNVLRHILGFVVLLLLLCYLFPLTDFSPPNYLCCLCVSFLTALVSVLNTSLICVSFGWNTLESTSNTIVLLSVSCWERKSFSLFIPTIQLYPMFQMFIPQDVQHVRRSEITKSGAYLETQTGMLLIGNLQPKL